MRVAGVGIKALDKALHHRAQIAGRIDPMLVRHEFECGAVEIEATVKVRQPLAIVLIPDNCPLREEIRRVGISGVVRHRPGQELALGIQCDGPAGDKGFICRRGNRKRLLAPCDRRVQ